MFVSPVVTANENNERPFASIYTDADAISSWAYDAIREATEKSIVKGNDGRIHPKNPITRAEFTKLIVTIVGIDTNISHTVSFTDVSVNDWFYPYVNAGYKEKIISGYTSSQFLPNGQITREEMATIIARALALPTAQPDTQIKDIGNVATWAQSSVKAIIAADLMQGYDHYFQPKHLATREMAIVVAMRAYHFQGGPARDPGGATVDRSETINQVISETATFMQKMVPDPTVGSIAGEWTIFGLARSNEKVNESYYEKYYANVVKEVKRLMPATASKTEGRLDRSKGTEHSRVILALTALGKDIRDVAGYDLRQALADFDYVTIQGINGPIFALIAFDSKNYEIPIVENVKTQTTRQRLIDFILAREITGGGWALGLNPPEADPDITAMALQSLTPYYHQRADVKAAIDRGVQWLSAAQDRSGGYRSWGSLNAESVAQVVVALSGLGIDADKDQRFVKNGNSALSALLSFSAKEGGFYHIKRGEVGNGGAAPGLVDPMATDQAMYALVAYQRFLEGKHRLYDMTDVRVLHSLSMSAMREVHL